METIEWCSKFEIDKGPIDSQHQNIVKIINNLVSTESLSIDSEIFTESLGELTRYVEEHFEFEEQLLHRAGYAEIERHKEQHREFQRKIAFLCIEATERKGSPEKEVIKYLVEWLNGHILIEDMKYKDAIDAV